MSDVSPVAPVVAPKPISPPRDPRFDRKKERTLDDMRAEYEKLAKAVLKTDEGTAARTDAKEAKRVAFVEWHDAMMAARPHKQPK